MQLYYLVVVVEGVVDDVVVDLVASREGVVLGEL